MRYTYQAVDGPLAQDPLALEDDQFDHYSNQIDITITDTGRVAVYRRRSKGSGYMTYYATTGGDPTAKNEDRVNWSYDSHATRALIFVGWKG